MFNILKNVRNNKMCTESLVILARAPTYRTRDVDVGDGAKVLSLMGVFVLIDTPIYANVVDLQQLLMHESNFR
jgi:hypothetical protein